MVECTQSNILQLRILSIHDPPVIIGYPMITYTHPAASNLAKKTMVAKQQPTNSDIIQDRGLIWLYILITSEATRCHWSERSMLHKGTQSLGWEFTGYPPPPPPENSFCTILSLLLTVQKLYSGRWIPWDSHLKVSLSWNNKLKPLLTVGDLLPIWRCLVTQK